MKKQLHTSKAKDTPKVGDVHGNYRIMPLSPHVTCQAPVSWCRKKWGCTLCANGMHYERIHRDGTTDGEKDYTSDRAKKLRQRSGRLRFLFSMLLFSGSSLLLMRYRYGTGIVGYLAAVACLASFFMVLAHLLRLTYRFVKTD